MMHNFSSILVVENVTEESRKPHESLPGIAVINFGRLIFRALFNQELLLKKERSLNQERSLFGRPHPARRPKLQIGCEPKAFKLETAFHRN